MRRIVLRVDASAVFFDLDGTLANTEPLHAEAWYSALLEVTGRQLDRSEYARQVVRGGLTPLEYVASLGIDLPDNPLHARKEMHYARVAHQRLLTREGASELIEALRAIPVPVGIVSSSSRPSVEIFVRLCWPAPQPDVVISRDDDVLRKPSPDPYRLAVRRLGRSAPMCVAIENSPDGIESAKAAGLSCVAIVTEDFTAADLSAADAIVTSFDCIHVTPGVESALMELAECER